MSDNCISTLLGEALLQAIRQAVREEIQLLRSESKDEDKLVSIDEAAELLDVSRDWLYRRATKLPFARKLGPKMLRFSYRGIQEYLSRKLG